MLCVFYYTVISILSSFRRLNSKRLIITSTQNISYNFNSKYLFEFLIENKSCHDFDVYYVMNDKDKRKYLNDFFNTNRFIEAKSIGGILFCLDAKYWVSSTFELPLNSLHKNMSRVVLHLGHGVPLKKIGLNEENIPILKRINRIIRTRQFTDIVCYSDILKKDMMRSFSNTEANYIFLGQPRNDNLVLNKKMVREELQKIAEADVDAKFILYAPTWRPYGATNFFPFSIDLDSFKSFLEENNIFIFTRSHPFYPSVIDESIKALANVISFNSIVAPEICDYLVGFDGLITDYSSIYIDYLVTDHKIAFIPYDYQEYKSRVGFCYHYENFTPGMKIKDESDFKNFLLSGDENYRSDRVEIMKITNTKSSGNCSEITEYLKSRS